MRTAVAVVSLTSQATKNAYLLTSLFNFSFCEKKFSVKTINRKRPDKIQVVLHPYFVRPCSLLTVWLFAQYEFALNESLRQ